MPEIDILHGYRWAGQPLVGGPLTPTVTIETLDGTVVLDELAESEANIFDLLRIGQEYGVTRWSERSPDDGLNLTSEITLIGWGEAPIARDDVQTSYHRSGRLPMVNVKVHDTDLPSGDAFASLLAEFGFEGEREDGIDSRLAALSPDELRYLIEQYLEQDDGTIFNIACENGFEQAEDDATSNCFPDYNVKLWTEGRQGGWLVVDGLPPVESWGPDLLRAWSDFEVGCKGLVANIPWLMAWHVLANCQDRLAGRILRIELTLTLSDRDLDKADENPAEWDWSRILDLDLDSTVSARKLP